MVRWANCLESVRRYCIFRWPEFSLDLAHIIQIAVETVLIRRTEALPQPRHGLFESGPGMLRSSRLRAERSCGVPRLQTDVRRPRGDRAPSGAG